MMCFRARFLKNRAKERNKEIREHLQWKTNHWPFVLTLYDVCPEECPYVALSVMIVSSQ